VEHRHREPARGGGDDHVLLPRSPLPRCPAPGALERGLTAIRLRSLLVLGFFLSGASGLVYEVIWLRWLVQVFGATTLAVSTVLTAFMAGLAGGSWVAGRSLPRLVRPVRVYGLLELAIGGFALVLPSLLPAIGPALEVLGLTEDAPPLATAVARLALTSGLLVVPTACMGATLPLLAEALSPPSRGSGWLSRLYGANVAGGVVGVAGAGFVLLPAFGVTRTNALAAALNLVAGLAGLWVDRRWKVAPGADTAAARDARSPDRLRAPRLARVAAALVVAVSGALAMLYELAWSRVLALVLGSSVYAFTVVLSTVLVGLAAGSYLAGLRPARLNPGAALGLAQLTVGLGALAGLAVVGELPAMFLAVFRLSGGAPAQLYPLEFLVAGAVILVPALGLGATLPLAVELETGQTPGPVGRTVSRLYALNSGGAVVGSAVGALLVLPWMGIRGTVLRAGLTSLAVAGLCFLAFPGRRRLLGYLAAVAPPAVGVGAVLVVPAWRPDVMTSGVAVYARGLAGASPRAERDFLRSERVLFYEDGLTATVSVGQRAGVMALRVNGKPDASTAPVDMGTQLLLAHLPLLLHPSPRDALVIGLGSGVSAGAALRHPIGRLTVVELEPAVVRASRLFDGVSGAPLDDPRVRLVVTDARTLLRLTRDRYDVIVSEPSNPWMTVAASLFTREFFELARARLRPGGLFAQWLQLYALTPDLLRSLMATYVAVFPHVAAFRASGVDLILVGSTEPLRGDYPTMAARLAVPAVSASLRRIGVSRVRDVLARLVLDGEDVPRFADGARLNTEDDPRVEFGAPRTLYVDSVDTNLAALAGARAARGALLARILASAPDGVRAELATRSPGLQGP
jgi:spermidine synthase